MKRLGDRTHEDVDLSVPVLFADLPQAELLQALAVALQTRFPPEELPRSTGRQAQYRQYQRALTLFAEYLAPRETVNLNEATLEEFIGHLAQVNDGGQCPAHWMEYTSNIRCLVNDLPEGIRRRPLLAPQQIRWAGKLEGIVHESQDLIRRFQRDGRKSKMKASGEVILKSQRLSETTRDYCVSSIRTLLKRMAIDDLRLLTPERIEDYLESCVEEGARRAALRHIANIRPICRFLQAEKIVAKDPLVGITERPMTSNMDYVDAEGIKKLGDLRTVDMNDVIDVRNRMIAYALCFDLALRRSEAAWLDVDDLRVRQSDFGMVLALHLPKEKQKGQNKRDAEIFSLFHQSAKLVARYLRLRQNLHPRDNALLISERGSRLLAVGLGNAVQTQCDKLGILTKGGKPVSPHRLRHSLATLNAMPLGRLDESDLAKRLRHENVQTTRRIYISDNPEIEWQRHQELLARMHKQAEEVPKNSSSPVPCSSPQTASLTELQAVEMLSEIGITPVALKVAATQDKALLELNKGFCYARSYIEDIRDNWTPKGEAKLMLQMTDHQLWHWLNLSGRKTRLIGKVSLIRRTDIWEELRRRASLKTA